MYKALEDINPSFKKGYEFYLDTLHKDHLELFYKGKATTVLNLHGIEIIDKKLKALGRRIPT